MATGLGLNDGRRRLLDIGTLRMWFVVGLELVRSLIVKLVLDGVLVVRDLCIV